MDRFPNVEKYAICDQLRRSSVSISSNIAEGQARGSNKAFINHLYIALGSSAEVQSQLYAAVELQYINIEDIQPLIKKLESIDMMLYKLIGYLKNQEEDKRTTNNE